MTSPPRNTEAFIKVEGHGRADAYLSNQRERSIMLRSGQHEEGIQKSHENPKNLPAEDVADKQMLWSRIDEQSSLICILKDRADETLLRYQALQKIISDLEDQAAQRQEELDSEKKKAETLEERLTDLAANNQAIISFTEELKKQNAQLKLENKQLQLEKDSHFNQKLHNKEELGQKLLQEINLLKKKLKHDGIESREKLAECEAELREQTVQHQAKEDALLQQLLEFQQKYNEAMEICKDLKLKLKETKEQQALKELSMKESIGNLTKEKDKLLIILKERDKVNQDQQEEIQELETKWRKEKNARIKAQNRFALEAEAVNAEVRVKSLQAALHESNTKFQKLNRDFDAFKDHSADLLTRERDLNKILRHMTG
ncbi:coiled-coil domain-containing protein 89 [Nematolebias whitei]|uniref:coiled-coil domain-containing protein 89 n=1 Tax=Nematolebias whitei TaxID=451745 RepID=UPI00189B1EF5|nr:coiled-coil domain-containing protein 89 [Nematolebias whitei]